MTVLRPQIIWAEKPECASPVAEIWIGEDDLWFVLFVNDADKKITIEVLPPKSGTTTRLVEFAEFERLLETAKRELMAIAAS